MKIKRRNIQSLQQVSMCHAYIGLANNLGWKKIRFQLPLNKTFCLTAPPLIQRRFKHRQRTKINKTMLPYKHTTWNPRGVFVGFLPHRFSAQSSQYQYWKANKYSILTVTELGPPVSESSTGSQRFMPPLILTTNFIKRESKIGYP